MAPHENDACRTGSAGWCCLGFRFDPGQQRLVRQAEQLYGQHLSTTALPQLDQMLTLARAAAQVTRATPGAEVKLEEAQTRLLRDALAYAATQSPAEPAFGTLAEQLAQALGANSR